MGFLPHILHWAGPWGAIYAAAIALFWLIYGKIWDEEKPRQQWIGGLYTDNRSRRYKLLLTYWLDAFDAILGRRETAVRRITDPQARDEAFARNRAAWSWGLLDFTLLLAIAYPLVALVVQWAVTGTDGRIGTLIFLPAEPQWWRRYVAVGGLAFVLGLIFLRPRFAMRFSRMLGSVSVSTNDVVAGAIAFALVIAFTVTIAGGVAATVASILTGAFVLVLALAVGIAVAVATAGGVAGASAIAIAVTVAIFGPVAFALAMRLAGALAEGGAHKGWSAFGGAGSFPFADAGEVAVTISGIGAFAFIVVTDAIRARFEEGAGRPVCVLLAYALLLYVFLIPASVALQASDPVNRPQIAGLFLLLGFLPLVNALADFLSTGLTRALLRIGTQHGQILAIWSGVDLAAGTAVFFALGCAMIGTVRLVAALGGPVLIDLPLMLGDYATPGSLRNDPHAYWWLYATFLSTLLPTFLHLVLGVFSLPFFTPRWLRYRIAGGLERAGQGDGPAGRWSCIALSATLGLAFTATAAAIWYGARALWYFYPHIGEAILWVFVALARAIGALP